MEEKKVPEEQVGKPEETKPQETKTDKPLTQEQFDKLYGEMKTAKEDLALEREKNRIMEEEKAKPATTTTGTTGVAPDWDVATGTTNYDEEYPLDKSQEKHIRNIIKQEIGQKEFVLTFKANENKVFSKHPGMINADGSYNYTDSKVKKYIEIGKKHPQLSSMVDGPIIAMRMMEGEMREGEIQATKAKAMEDGKREEVKRSTEAEKAFTGSSTVSKPKETTTKLSEAEHRIALRMRMTDEEYMANKGRRAIEQPKGAKL